MSEKEEGVKKVLIIRYGAFGDCIFATPLPRLLKEQGFNIVDVETNFKGYQVFGNNPFIDNLLFYEPNPAMTFEKLRAHWEEISKGYDKVINLFASLEHGCIAMEEDELYYKSDSERRKELGLINFYDQTIAWAGYHELCGKYKPELYFTKEEIEITEQWLKQFEGKFLVMINLNGTSRHKDFVNAKEVAFKTLEKYPDAWIILTGDNPEKEFEGERITSIVKKKPFMQAVLISKYVDLVITPESGLGVGAQVWGTPTIFLLTSSSWDNVCKYAENDLSLQSPAECSPCHKGPYEYRGCQMKDGKPICVYFNIDEIMKRVERARQIKENKICV